MRRLTVCHQKTNRVWYAASGLILLVSPLINYGLGHIRGSISPWRYMYIVGGLVTTLWSFVIYFFMPPDPIRARGFNDRERYIAIARLRVNNGGVRNTHFKRQHVLELLTDEKFWLIFAQSFLSMIASGPVNTFMPIIIAGFGFNVLNTLLLTIPAGAVGAILILSMTYATYKLPNVRTYAIFFCELLVIMSSLLLWLLPRDHKGGLLFAVYMMTAYSGGWGVIMGLSIANSAGYTKRVVSSSAIHIGYCLGKFRSVDASSALVDSDSSCPGQFTAPQLFTPKDAPDYAPGFIAVLVTACASAGLAILYRFVCFWHNRRRDRAGIPEGFDHAYEDDVTDRKVSVKLHCKEENSISLTPVESSIQICLLEGLGSILIYMRLDDLADGRGLEPLVSFKKGLKRRNSHKDMGDAGNRWRKAGFISPASCAAVRGHHSHIVPT